MRTFITQPGNRIQLLESAYSFGRIKNLLRRLCNPLLKQDYSSIDSEINESLINFWDSEDKQEEFDKLHEQIVNAVFNVVQLSEDPSISMESLIRTLLHYGGRLSMTRFTLLDYIIHHFGKGHNQSLYKQVSSRLMLFTDEINRTQEKILKDWIHYYLSHRLKLNNWIMGRHFVLRYSQAYKDDYAQKIEEIIKSAQTDNYKIIVSLMNCTLTPSYPKGDFRLESIVNELIPVSIRTDFISRLEAIDKGLLDADDQAARKFFLERVNKKKAFGHES